MGSVSAAGEAMGKPCAVAHSMISSRFRKWRPRTQWEGTSPFSTCSSNARSESFNNRAASLTVNCIK
jgi:hypothetical protein